MAGLFRQPAWARAAALLVVVLLTLGFSRVAVTAASDALPGDTLYPVKLAAEQAGDDGAKQGRQYNPKVDVLHRG